MFAVKTLFCRLRHLSIFCPPSSFLYIQCSSSVSLLLVLLLFFFISSLSFLPVLPPLCVAFVSVSQQAVCIPIFKKFPSHIEIAKEYKVFLFPPRISSFLKDFEASAQDQARPTDRTARTLPLAKPRDSKPNRPQFFFKKRNITGTYAVTTVILGRPPFLTMFLQILSPLPLS